MLRRENRLASRFHRMGSRSGRVSQTLRLGRRVKEARVVGTRVVGTRVDTIDNERRCLAILDCGGMEAGRALTVALGITR